MKDPITVHARWDPAAEVWIAISDDVPGLATEAATQQELEEKLMVMVPELLVANGLIECTDHPRIPLHLLSEKDLEAVACA